MRITLMNFLIFISILSYSQKYNIEVLLKPSLSNKILYGDDERLINILKNNVQAQPSYNIDMGILINKKFNKTKKTGNKEFNYSSYLGTGVDLLRYGARYHSDNMVSIDETYILTYLGIPVQFTKQILGNKNVTITYSNNLLLKETIKYKYNSSRYSDTTEVRKTNELKKLNYRIYNPSIEIAAGFDVNLYNNLRLNIQPSFNIFISSVQKEPDIKNLYYKAVLNIRFIKDCGS